MKDKIKYVFRAYTPAAEYDLTGKDTKAEVQNFLDMNYAVGVGRNEKKGNDYALVQDDSDNSDMYYDPAKGGYAPMLEPDGLKFNKLYSPYANTYSGTLGYWVKDSDRKRNLDDYERSYNKTGVNGWDHLGSLTEQQKAFADRRNKTFIPHRGISVLGLADPALSLYHGSDMFERFPMFSEQDTADSIERPFSVAIGATLGDSLFKDYKDNSRNVMYNMLAEQGYKNALDMYRARKATGVKPGREKDDVYERMNRDTKVYNPYSGMWYDMLAALDDTTVGDDVKDYIRKMRKVIEAPENSGKSTVPLDGRMPVALRDLLKTSYITHRNRLQRHWGLSTLDDLPYGRSLDKNSAANWYYLFRTLFGGEQPPGKLYLAEVPEDMFYTNEEVRQGKLAGQRDFPEELVVKQLRPVRRLIKPDDYVLDKNGAPRYDAFTRYILNSGYSMADPEMYMRFLWDHYGVDPDKVVSDRTKKDIWADLSGYRRRRNTQRNINSALEGLR